MSAARTERLLHHFFTAIARLPHCRPHPGEAWDGLPMHPSPRCAPLMGHRALERPLDRAPSSSVAGHGGRSVRFSYWKINPKPENPRHFVERPLYFFKIKPQSMNFQEEPWFLKYFQKMPIATFQKFQIGPIISFRHIFTTVILILVILAPKFLESLPLSSYAFINTCLLHIDWFCVYFMLGNTAPEPFFKDLQDQAFEETHLFFADQQGKSP
jgi:hypothetical protein